MGEVYQARDEQLERDVALKLLPRDKTTDALAIERFLREAKVTSALNHPNIVTVHVLLAERRDAFTFVAQISNLLCRRFPLGKG